MGVSYKLIASQTLGSDAATVTFTSIPSTYTDLVLKYSIRHTTGFFAGMSVQLNSTSSVYSNTILYGTGSAVSTYGNTAGAYFSEAMFSIGASATAGVYATGELNIPNYTNSKPKTITSFGASEINSGSNRIVGMSGLYNTTSAVSTLKIYDPINSYSMLAGSTFYLYGITNVVGETGSKAVGGVVTTAGGYTYHTFDTSGTFTPTTNITGAEVLTVAGGGGGGYYYGGGGGAGGLVYSSSQSFTSGVSYPAIVGAGGSFSSSIQGSNGTNSRFHSLTAAVGGGGGGTGAGAAGTYNNGIAGGSGGGGSSGYNFNNTNGTGGSATAGQGNAGGTGAKGASNAAGGGGGGAGAVGGNGNATTPSTVGGAGLSTYSAWGAATSTGQNVSGTYWYAGGGAGGTGTSNAGVGGNGGGGGEGSRGPNGLTKTGGGGAASGTSEAGNGGSGIVIVRYTT